MAWCAEDTKHPAARLRGLGVAGVRILLGLAPRREQDENRETRHETIEFTSWRGLRRPVVVSDYELRLGDDGDEAVFMRRDSGLTDRGSLAAVNGRAFRNHCGAGRRRGDEIGLAFNGCCPGSQGQVEERTTWGVTFSEVALAVSIPVSMGSLRWMAFQLGWDGGSGL
jgi:hypothetical protein